MNITAVNGRTDKDKTAIIHMTGVRDRAHLEQVMNKVKKVRMYIAHRYTGGS